MNTTSLLAVIVLASAVLLSGCIQEEPPGLVVMTPTPGPAPAVTPAPPPTPTAPAEEVAEPTPTPTMNITRTLCDYPPCGEGGGGSSGNVVSPPVPELCTLAMVFGWACRTISLEKRMSIVFECRRCGHCCNRIVVEDMGENHGLCLLHGEKKLFREFPDAVLPYIGIRKPGRSRIKVVAYQMVQAPCPLLDAEGCTRYADRPTACRSYPFSCLLDGVSLEMTCPWSKSHDFACGMTQIRTGAVQDAAAKKMKSFFVGLHRRMQRTGYTRLVILDCVTTEWAEVSADR